MPVFVYNLAVDSQLTISKKVFRKALKRAAQPRIFSRGLWYFRYGRVKEWSAKEDATGKAWIITGKVKGGRIYDVSLGYDPEAEKFFDVACACPYEGVCKHIVALGLAFAESLNEQVKSVEVSRTKSATDEPINDKIADEGSLRRALKSLGLAAETVPSELITQLLNYRQLEFDIVGNVKKLPSPIPVKVKRKPFDPGAYYLVLNVYDGYIPTFYEAAHAYQQADINKVLARNDLSSPQRELLTYIKDGRFGFFNAPRPDPGKLLPLIAASGFPVYGDYYSTNKPLTIDLQPQPLQAEIIYEPESLEYPEETKTRHDFFFRLPEIYWKGLAAWYEKPFSISDSCLVRQVGQRVELHKITTLLSGILTRLEPVIDYIYAGRGYKAKYHQVRLTGEELSRFSQLVEDASQSLVLTSPPPPFTSELVKDEPRPTLLVDFDNDQRTLRVTPVIDYVIYKQDIAESVYFSRRGRSGVFKRRAPFEQPGTHVITVADNVIRCAKINEKKEMDFYKELSERAEDFGFTKTLRCLRRGPGPLSEYRYKYWPVLSGYCREKNYPILFKKDQLAFKQETFRAEFNADLNSDNDWLYFDVACYCGDEAVTLEKLLAFLESGQLFWRKEDGTLVEISNRNELERLAALLKSFHARENGGFEGKLYHTTELEYVMTCSPYYNAVRTKSLQQFLNRAQEGKPVKEIRLPERLNKILRPYQKAGVEWLYFLRSYRFAGILADEMGLGKTLQTLTVLNLEKVSGRSSVVVCPKTLLYNWKLEAKKFFPRLKVLIYDGSPVERWALVEKIKDYDLVIVSYGTLKQDESPFSKFRFNYAVLDEAQFIKNHATKNAQIVKKLNADYRLALTGTPLENSVQELWSIYDFLMPAFLGNHEHFTRHFKKPIMDAGDRQALEHLRRKIESFMLRRTKGEVLKELPPKIEQESICQLSADQNVLYQQILSQVRGEVFEAVRVRGFQSAQINILAGLTKLRQACNHPALLTKNKDWHAYKSAKLEMCLELVDEVVESRRKVLIFSQFTQMLDIISAALKEKDIPNVYLSGKTRDRQNLVDKFNTDPTIPVFLISLRAGGTGLNLTAADTVIIFDPWWNPSVENQAADRTHRIGQTKTVNVYRLLTSGTIEEKIKVLKQKKQRLFNALAGESGDLFKKLTWDDVRELFAD